MKEIALIGHGYWGEKLQKYIPAFFNITYIADSSFKQNIIWEDPEIAGVIIATPEDTHFDIAQEALLHNKHIFVEKPLATTHSDAIALKSLSKKVGRKVGIDLIYTFSHSIQQMVDSIDMIGEIEFIDMGTRQLGRFKDFDVYWTLASHHLAILDMIRDLDKMEFTFADAIYHNGKCSTGAMIFPKGKIDISLNSPHKEMYINIYGTKGTIRYDLRGYPSLRINLYDRKYMRPSSELITENIIYHSDNEGHNLRFALKYFKDLMEGKEKSNIDTAIKIVKILER